MLSAGDPATGSAGYVALEVAEVSIGERSGSFCLQQLGVMDNRDQSLTLRSSYPGDRHRRLRGRHGAVGAGRPGPTRTTTSWCWTSRRSEWRARPGACAPRARTSGSPRTAGGCGRCSPTRGAAAGSRRSSARPGSAHHEMGDPRRGGRRAGLRWASLVRPGGAAGRRDRLGGRRDDGGPRAGPGRRTTCWPSRSGAPASPTPWPGSVETGATNVRSARRRGVVDGAPVRSR